jgi:hypothetical protein
MKKQYRIWFGCFTLISSCFFISSCHDDEVVNQSPVATFEVNEGIDRMSFDASGSSDPDGSPLTYRWTSSAGAFVAGTTNPNAAVWIPGGGNQNTIDVTLTVSDGITETSATHSVIFPKLTPVREYGLGRQLVKEASNSQKYEWYMDQGVTGIHSLLNCGPTSVTMAIKWAKEDFAPKPADARERYRPSGGWWYTNDILNYLNDYDINNWVISLSNNFHDIKGEIDDGNIVILCLDMHSIGYNAERRHHYDKFYETDAPGWGHFIVIKGYKEVDNQTFYEAYDPYSLSRAYEDGSLKGRDRYYRASTLESAVKIWWNNAIIVSRAPATGGRRGINVDEIVHMPGR